MYLAKRFLDQLLVQLLLAFRAFSDPFFRTLERRRRNEALGLCVERLVWGTVL